MTRTLTVTIASLLAGPALAHPGHLTEAAGHDHWIAGAAVGAAIVVGLWGFLKGRAKKSASTETSKEEPRA